MQPQHSDPDIDRTLTVLREVIDDKTVPIAVRMDAAVKLSTLTIKLTPDVADTPEEREDARRARTFEMWEAIQADRVGDRRELSLEVVRQAEHSGAALVKWQLARRDAQLDWFADVNL